VSKHAKHKRPRAPVATLPELKARIDRALQEGRYQTALELARSLFKAEASAAHRNILQKAALGRARQLRGQGHTSDAAHLLNHVMDLASDPGWLVQIAEEYAACSEGQKALAILKLVSEPAARTRVLARLADGAIHQGKPGREKLPEDLQAQFDVVMQAFALAETAHDDEARALLQGIGLQSPFLEWKVFLRGLLAYYQNEDSRALENWQRLDNERLPARLAAPLRFGIDSAYRLAQPPAAQNAMRRELDRLQGSGVVPLLRALQPSLASEQKLPQAFRQAETVLPHLRREAPLLVPRLASCFYWAIIDHGHPDDLTRYKKAFGTPAEDPHLAKLQALAQEQRGLMQEAHQNWQVFANSVAANPLAWPGEQGTRVRSLVWAHMGRNADEVPDLAAVKHLPPFVRNHPDLPRPLKPSAEECFQTSIKLAPDTLEPREALFEHFRSKKKVGKAIQAGRQLLERFPDQVPTLDTLGDLLMEKQDYAEAIELFARAVKANPLERRLRAKLSTAHTYNARTFAEQRRFEQARAEYQAALSLSERQNDSSVLCKWAACEFKAAASQRAEELLSQAHAEAGNRLAVAFSMLIEVIRLGLPRTFKSRFDAEFKAALAEPATGAGALAIALTAASHRLAGVTYHGQKTHEKKVLSYLDKARNGQFTEPELEGICAALKSLDTTRLLTSYVRLGQERFPASPMFFLMEAEEKLRRGAFWNIEPLLNKARELASVLPRDDRQKALLETIEGHEQRLRMLNPFADLFGRLGEGGFPMPFGMDFDDMFDDDEDEDDF
jgi:tetratricopeptide (TPR) repeat protein